MAWIPIPIPRPDQVVGASMNVAKKSLYGGLADLRPMPRTLIDEGILREVYHYRPAAGVEPKGDPVLLVTPLAAPSLCFDLRRGCSVVEHLIRLGRPTYLVEYGPVAFSDRHLGLEHWVDEVLPAAIGAVSQHAGDRPVHLVGWSLGGIFALLTGADHPELPIDSVTAVGTPIDVQQVPLVAPLRPLLNVADGRLVTGLYTVLGGAPRPIVKRAFQLSSLDKLVTKPLAMVRHLDDADFLAQIEAVDRFTDNMYAYPGRSFGQLYHRFLRGNVLATGAIDIGHRTVEIDAFAKPLLVVAGSGDGIAPVGSVRALVDLVPRAEPVRFEVVPGGHLGALTGRAARRTTWRILDEFLATMDDRAEVESAAPTGTSPLGANRKRRYSSAATRDALSR